VRELLCPAGIEQYVAAPHDYALDSLFAERTPKTLYVRGRARKYLFVVPPYVQPYAVSAIVAAGSAARRSNDNVGEAIASLIESIGGPAEHQTGQSAQGHPQTPDDIRQALAHLKTMASPPLRWDLMVHYHRTVPASLQAKILHVGEILGAGSMYIALEVTWHDGSTKVLSLLRPHAENRGETGFAFLEACFEDDASSTGEVVRELLKAGRGLMRTQLNSARAVEVGRRAQTVYRGRKVSIEGAQFDFAAPEIIEAAAGCFVSNLAVGPHIIDLKEQTRVERQDKRQVCMALVTTELVHLFSGGYFDNDRHGGNAKKQERTIQPFDLWGLLNEPGSEEAVRAFATAFFRSLAHARSMKSFQAQFAENLRTLAPKNDNYISNAQRALLVLAEYRSVLSLPDYLECLGAALPQVPAFVSEIAQKELSTTFLGKILSWRLSSVGQRGNAIVHERN
jgi:hypothetical protein